MGNGTPELDDGRRRGRNSGPRRERCRRASSLRKKVDRHRKAESEARPRATPCSRSACPSRRCSKCRAPSIGGNGDIVTPRSWRQTAAFRRRAPLPMMRVSGMDRDASPLIEHQVFSTALVSPVPILAQKTFRSIPNGPVRARGRRRNGRSWPCGIQAGSIGVPDGAADTAPAPSISEHLNQRWQTRRGLREAPGFEIGGQSG